MNIFVFQQKKIQIDKIFKMKIEKTQLWKKIRKN